MAYAFDFRGGAHSPHSTGKTTECSILTEADDLTATVDTIRGLDVVDARSVFLLGQSQGGSVSAIVAARRPEDVAGLILPYLAFVIHDAMLERFGSAGKVPETFSWWHELGRIYATGAIGYDLFEHIGDYEGPVLTFHGTADTHVPIEHARRETQTYRDAALVVMRGAGHGFYGSKQRRVLERTGALCEEHAHKAVWRDGRVP